MMFFTRSFPRCFVPASLGLSFVMRASVLVAISASAQAQQPSSDWLVKGKPVQIRSLKGPNVAPLQAAATLADAPDEAVLSRLDALELELAKTKQTQSAQQVLATRSQMSEAMQLRNRLEVLESKLSGVNPQSPLTGNAPDDFAARQAQNDAIARSRLNELEDTMRLTRGQIDSLVLQMETLIRETALARADTEFRFQQFEASQNRAENGGILTAVEPQVLGRIQVPDAVIAVQSMDGGAGETSPSNPLTPLTPLNPETPAQGMALGLVNGDKLIGEGDMPTLAPSVPVRPKLQDPKQLYDRALTDLRKGLYLEAEGDLVQILTDFPAHSLAGNAQYWLGETFYVRQDYKRAAEAFLSGYTKYAKSIKAPDSLLKLGITLIAMDEKKTGCDALAELGAKFPEAPQAIVKRAEIEKRRAGCQN
ncbi:tol-pal system protein YbgF [Alphaproteobacteria bacterium]|nr:tol-pal system protein YbgF [Alphaproteobacteria bacterium]